MNFISSTKNHYSTYFNKSCMMKSFHYSRTISIHFLSHPSCDLKQIIKRYILAKKKNSKKLIYTWDACSTLLVTKLPFPKQGCHEIWLAKKKEQQKIDLHRRCSTLLVTKLPFPKQGCHEIWLAKFNDKYTNPANHVQHFCKQKLWPLPILFWRMSFKIQGPFKDIPKF